MQKETIIQGMLMCLSYLEHLCLDLLFTVLSCYEVQEVIYTLCTILSEDYINLVLSGTIKKHLCHFLLFTFTILSLAKYFVPRHGCTL